MSTTLQNSTGKANLTGLLPLFEKWACFFVILYMLMNQSTIISFFFRDQLGLRSTNTLAWVIGAIATPIIAPRFFWRFANRSTLIDFKTVLISIPSLYILGTEILDGMYSEFGMKAAIIVALNFMIIFFTASNIWLRKGENSLPELLAPYLFFCSVTAFTGIVSFFLVNFNLTDLSDWDHVNSYLKKGAEGFNGKLYTMPYYLGLVLTGDNPLYILGKPFYRLAGFSIEPQIASYMYVPAFIWSLQNSKLKWLALVTGTFLIMTGAMTTVLGLTCLCIAFVLFKRVTIDRRAIAIGMLALGGCLFVIGNVGFQDSIGIIFRRLSNPSSLAALESIYLPLVESSAFLGFGLLSVIDGLPYPTMLIGRGVLGLCVYWLTSIIFSVMSIVRFSIRPDQNIFLLLPVYLVLHWMKSPPHFFYFSITHYFLILYAFWIVGSNSKWQSTTSS